MVYFFLINNTHLLTDKFWNSNKRIGHRRYHFSQRWVKLSETNIHYEWIFDKVNFECDSCICIKSYLHYDLIDLPPTLKDHIIIGTNLINHLYALKVECVNIWAIYVHKHNIFVYEYTLCVTCVLLIFLLHLTHNAI